MASEKLYILSDSGVPEGPYTPAQLRAKGVTADTQIWDEATSKWLPAKEIPGFFSTFMNEAPEEEPAEQPASQSPIPKSQFQNPNSRPQHATRFMLQLMLQVIIAVIVTIITTLIIIN